MNFDSAQYLGLLAATLIVMRLLPGDRLRHLLLLLASYGFYAAWDWRLLGLVLRVTGLSFVGGLMIGARRTEGRNTSVTLAVFVGLLLLPLAVFKYFDFFSLSLAELVSRLGWHCDGVTLHRLLPIGISFYTFHAISYVADIQAGRLGAERSLIRYGLYICFFPQLIAGPIVRSTDFLPQLHRQWQPPSAGDVARHLARFVWGMAKKILIADRLAAAIVDPAFADPAAIDALTAALAAIAFTVMIYADFSGYSDMAIASAGLLGYRFKENFQAPYLAAGVREFWRRWHISLSSWIRDYVYIGLGGNRSPGRWRPLVNLAVAMFLCGLWHGAAWTYVLWGLWHGVALGLERLLGKAGPVTLFGRIVHWAVTMTVVVLGWILFRARDLPQTMAFLGAFFDSGRTHAPYQFALWLVLGLSGLLVLVEHVVIERRRGRPAASGGIWTGLHVAAACILGLMLLFLSSPNVGARNFIYFQF